MDKVYLGRSIAEFSPGIASKPISKVELLDENGDVVASAGDDTGKTLTALNPDGTAEMARAVLGKVKGYSHTGYEGSDALLNIAAEIGDAMTVAGHYVPLITQEINFSALCASGISSPDADELDDEYPYKSPTQRQIERNMAKTRSLITKTSDAINLRIDGVNGDVSSLRVSLDNVQSVVSTKIDGKTAQSMINQSIDKIELSVSSGSGGSTFTLKAGSTTLSTDTLDLHVKAINIDGLLKASQIQTGSIYVGDLADGSNYATKTYVDNNAGLSANEVDSAIATYIDDHSITAEILRGRTVELLASSNKQIGSIELVDTSTGYGVSINTDYGGIQLNSGGNIYLSADSDRGAFVTIADDYISLGRGALIIGSNVYGTSLPSRPQYGQLFFLKQ